MSPAPFTAHRQTVPLSGILCPRYVFPEVRRVETDRAAIDARTDAILERQRRADLAHENQTEARAFPQRTNRHDD